MAEPRTYSVSLADGTPVLLRPIGPGDREAVLEAFRRLSPESRYGRFWTRYEKLPDSILQRFLHADHVNQAVWAALDPARPGELGFGAGSWWREAPGATEAEVSFTIADEAQHRGIGTLLLAVLWHLAREKGITCLRGHALPDNHAVLDWFRRLGAAMALEHGQIIMRLPLEPRQLRESPASARLRQWLAFFEQAG